MSEAGVRQGTRKLMLERQISTPWPASVQEKVFGQNTLHYIATGASFFSHASATSCVRWPSKFVVHVQLAMLHMGLCIEGKGADNVDFASHHEPFTALCELIRQTRSFRRSV